MRDVAVSEQVSGVLEQKPFVSVVVPVYNQASFIATCLTALFVQTYPIERYGIILVDDGSTDETVASALEGARGWRGEFQLVRRAHGGPASARNAGIWATGAEIIAFIDADCVAEADWLRQLVEALTASEAAGVGGPLINAGGQGWVFKYLDAAAFFRHRVRHGQVDYLLTANAAFRRAALLNVNGFSEQRGAWCEDADLSFRLQQSGHTLRLAQGGSVSHFGAPSSVRELIKSLYRYGYGNSVLARNWRNGRTLAMELVRHGGAIVLAPALALAYAFKRKRGVGLLWASAFWPLIVIEHAAFVVGLLAGWRLSAPTQEHLHTSFQNDQEIERD